MKKFLLCIVVVLWATTLQAAVTAWVHPYLRPMVKEAAAPSQIEKTMSLKVTPGEYEPAAFALRSDIEDSVVVALSGLEGEDWLPSCWCELHKVMSMNEKTQPNRLFEYANPVRLAAGKTQFFWLTVHPPEGAKPGTYVGRVFLKAGHVAQTLEITCEVLPFTLQKSRITGGAFMSETNLPPGWYQDMKEHGLDAIQSFWAYDARITRRGDKVVIDQSPLNEYVSDLNAAGMRGPVVISLGNDYHLHYERRIAEAFGMPLDTGKVIGGKAEVGPPITPKLDSLFVDGLRQIRDNWKNKDYPQELIVLIYDEPTERLLARCKNRYDLLKTVMPNVRVYGVVMNRRALAESMIDQMDIIVCNGDFEGNRELATQNHKGFWVYSGFQDPNSARYNMGCMPWRADAEGVFFWMYNYWSYDPNACAVYRHPDDPNKLVRSTMWEGVREGMDDLRYFATAEKLIERAPADKKEAASAQLAKVRESLDPRGRRRMQRGQATDEAAQVSYFNVSQNTREELIKIILDLL